MKNVVFKKRGITVAMAATMILIIALLTTTITIAVVKTVKSSKLKAFATELSVVQNTIGEASFLESINKYLGDDVVLTLTSTEQFGGETITSNSVLLHKIDLDSLGIKKSVYGTGKNGTKDYYAISLDTLKVYYIAGYDDGSSVYYTLTDELLKLLSGENKAVHKRDIVFKASTVEWTSTPVTVTVQVPTSITISTVTVTTNNTGIVVGSFTNKEGYNECKVNTSNVGANFVITVSYTLNGSQKTETYAVTNYDNTAPTITAGSVQKTGEKYYLNNIAVTDNGKIRKVKYTDVEVPTNDVYEFFKTNGNDLLGNKIKLDSETSTYTIYAEDYAGNYSVLKRNQE